MHMCVVCYVGYGCHICVCATCKCTFVWGTDVICYVCVEVFSVCTLCVCVSLCVFCVLNKYECLLGSTGEWVLAYRKGILPP